MLLVVNVNNSNTTCRCLLRSEPFRSVVVIWPKCDWPSLGGTFVLNLDDTANWWAKKWQTSTLLSYGLLGPVSRKSRELFGPEKPFVKLVPAFSVKLVFSYVVKGVKINAKFRASRRLSFEDTKRIMSPEMRPKSLGTFEKQAPGPVWLLVAFFL